MPTVAAKTAIAAQGPLGGSPQAAEAPGAAGTSGASGRRGGRAAAPGAPGARRRRSCWPFSGGPELPGLLGGQVQGHAALGGAGDLGRVGEAQRAARRP